MIRYGKQQEIDAYFESPDVNQSYLKRLLQGVEYLEPDEKKLFYEEKGHFIIGNGVDMILTQGMREYEESFKRFRHKKPSAVVMSIVQMVFDNCDSEYKELVEYQQEILEACDRHSYYTNRKPETRIKGIVDEGRDYFIELEEAVGKQIVSSIEDTIINNIQMGLRTHKHTGRHFQVGRGEYIFYQVPIYFTINNIKCKVLLDMVKINVTSKTIQPFDIKTTGEQVLRFPSIVKKRGYHIQAAFYHKALSEFKKGRATTIKELDDLAISNSKDNYWTIHPMKFLVDTTMFKEDKMTGEIYYAQGNPMTFTLSREFIELGRYGRPELWVKGAMLEPGSSLRPIYDIKQYEIKGYEQALDLHLWHTENGFEYNRDVVLADGDLIIK